MCADWHRRLTVSAALAAIASLGAAQGAPSPADIAKAVREYRVAHEQPIIQELVDLLAIPNIASDEPNIRRNADRLRVMLERRGFGCGSSRSRSAGRSSSPTWPRPAPRAPSCSTRTTTASRRTRKPGRAPVPSNPASGPTASRRAARFARSRAPARRTRTTGASTRARPPTTSRPSSRCSPRSMRSPATGIPRAVNLRVVLDSEEENGSPGAGAGARRAPRPRARRPARHRRRPRAPVRTPARVLREPRRVRLQSHRLRPGARPAQRPLRQLGAEPGDAAVAAPRVHEGRLGARAHRRVLCRRACR